MKRDTLLHVAARSGHLNTLRKALTDERINVDSRNEKNMTALHVAAESGNAQACEVLIKHGAHIFLTTDSGLTALHLATKHNHPDCVLVLLKYGCNPYMLDAHGRTAVSLINTAELAETFFTFFSTVRRNPTMLQRLEKDLLWKDIDDLLSEAAGYDSFRYDEAESKLAEQCRPMAYAAQSMPAPPTAQVRS